MPDNLPRIDDLTVMKDTVLLVHWRGSADEAPSEVDLSGWIGTGGVVLEPLRDPALFSNARVGDHGASVTWDEGAGDLSIDTLHLRLLTDEQRPFNGSDIGRWQVEQGLSNQEAADLLRVAPSTWSAYKASPDREVPRVVAILCRAVRRDPLILQAHYRPRRSGRPRGGVSRA